MIEPYFGEVMTCTCCGIVHDGDAWAALSFVGRMVDEVETLELRNCECGSTLAIEVTS
jgi:hypothetical protein